MGRPIHFEIHVNDMVTGKSFMERYSDWSFEDWSDYAGMPYFGAVTANEKNLESMVL